MEKFDITGIIEHYNLDAEALAKVLFPTVKYPKLAFDRVLKGETSLDVEQIKRLAEFAGVFISDLFNISSWAGSSEDGCLTFIRGPYKAKLNYAGAYLSIYKNNELIQREIISAPSMPVQEFIKYLNNFITTYENGDN